MLPITTLILNNKQKYIENFPQLNLLEWNAIKRNSPKTKSKNKKNNKNLESLD